MLPQLDLDDEKYQEILSAHKKKISNLSKEWTDYNEHDPGITFLELLSWMKEMQQFYLDQVTPDQYDMFLRLLGMQRIRKKPVYTYATLEKAERDFFLPENTRIYAGDICYETQYPGNILKNELLYCERNASGRIEIFDGKFFKDGYGRSCSVFGDDPKTGDSFCIWMKEPFQNLENCYIHFLLKESDIKRMPITDGFEPFVRIECSLICGTEKKKFNCTVKKDETYNLLYSGELCFSADDEYIKRNCHNYGNEPFGICLTLAEGEYDILPVIRGIEWNSIPVIQTKTMTDFVMAELKKGEDSFELYHRIAFHGQIECYREKDGLLYLTDDFVRVVEDDRITILFETPVREDTRYRVVLYETAFARERIYEMNGLPSQSIDLENDELLWDGLELIAEHPVHKGVYESYKRVENFYASGKESRHYVFDEERGLLLFGDCEHGMAPKGTLKLIRYKTSLGIQGNIKRNQLKMFEDDTIPAAADNVVDTLGGCEKESIDACFARYLREEDSKERAVTIGDYERLVYTTPGLCIHKVKAVSGPDNSVILIVKPYSYRLRPILSEVCRRNIYNYLEPKRMIGTSIVVCQPEYVGITLFVELVGKSYYKNIKETVESAVMKYFATELFDFGKTLLYGKLYRAIESLECVAELKMLSVQAQGKGIKVSENGDCHMPVNALCYPEQIDITFTLL